MEETLTRLKAAGLHSVPGGGAEILVDRVRDFISPYKDTAEEWLDCMRVAHRVGLRSSATMMYGSVDTSEDRVEHLLKLRDLQDESLAGAPAAFTAFIAWNYQPDGTNSAARARSASIICARSPSRACCSTTSRTCRLLGDAGSPDRAAACATAWTTSARR
jgi:cyclic dehypoxanthinyl futalosine synthase